MKIKNKLYSKEVIAVACMVFSIVCSGLNRVLLKSMLLQQSYHPLSLLLAQSFIGATIVGSILLYQQVSLFPQSPWQFQLSRAFFAVSGYYLLLQSLQLFSLYVNTLIGLITVILTSIISVIIFERRFPHPLSVIGTLLGTTGAFISIKSIPLEHLSMLIYPIMASILLTLSSIILKHSLKNDSKNNLQHLFSLLFWMTFFLGLSGSHTREIGALCYQPVTFALAILYILCQGSYIVSYQHAELSFLGPLKFLKTPLAAVLDYHFFTVVASQRDIIAGMMIITGVILGYISKNMTQKTPEQTAY